MRDIKLDLLEYTNADRDDRARLIEFRHYVVITPIGTNLDHCSCNLSINAHSRHVLATVIRFAIKRSSFHLIDVGYRPR